MSDTGNRRLEQPSERSLVAAIFGEKAAAEDALWDLHEHGFRPEDVGVAMRDPREAHELARTMAETEAEEGAAIGAVAGGALGGVAGWLVGIGALIIPGVGPIIAAGPLAIALGGAVLGAATGGVVGALVGEGIPEETARWYEEAIKAGSVLVTVRAGGRAAETRSILRRWGGIEERERETVGASPEERLAGEIHPPSELTPQPPPVIHGGSAVVREARAETLRRGWKVLGVDGVQVGVVQEVEPDRVKVDRGLRLGSIAIPLGAVQRAERGEVRLSLPSDQIDRQGWVRTQPSTERVEETRSMSDMERTARQMTGGVRETLREMREGRSEEAMGGMLSIFENIPTSTYYYLTIGSILGSAWLFLTGRKWEGIFVGLWAPTFITSGLFYKLLHPSRDVR